MLSTKDLDKLEAYIKEARHIKLLANVSITPEWAVLTEAKIVALLVKAEQICKKNINLPHKYILKGDVL